LNEKSTMRRLQRLIAASVLMALSGAVAGCSSQVNSFDPMDWFDWLDSKKKLQGERKSVFPEGVPGMEQGVPKSLYKGSQLEADQNAQAAAAAAPPPPEAKPARGAKSKSKPPSDTATAAPSGAPEEDATAAAPPAPKPKKIVRQRTTAPPPDQPADAQPTGQQSAQSAQPAQQSAAPFPAPLPSGTFTR
jgi:hypothetical protein